MSTPLEHVSRGVDITVMYATGDSLISFEDAKAGSMDHPGIKFVLTEVSHSNIYEPTVRGLIIAELSR